MRMISFQAPAPRMNMNDRKHWSVKMKQTAAWRQAAFYAAKQARLPDLSPAIVQVMFAVPYQRRRDPHNMAPTVKAIIDGLTDAKVFPDDSEGLVAVMDSVFEVVVGQPDQVTVLIRPMENTT